MTDLSRRGSTLRRTAAMSPAASSIDSLQMIGLISCGPLVVHMQITLLYVRQGPAAGNLLRILILGPRKFSTDLDFLKAMFF